MATKGEAPLRAPRDLPLRNAGARARCRGSERLSICGLPSNAASSAGCGTIT
jgi:hypothetical protein